MGSQRLNELRSTNSNEDLSNLATNLKLLCGFYRSISDVCRRIEVNRSQFNKYLSGSTHPSRYTMRKIAAFFGVEDYELQLPPRQLAMILELRPVRVEHESQNSFEKHVRNLQHFSSRKIQKYQGYYFEYYMSLTYPGHILRSLVHLHCEDSVGYYKRIERLSPVHRGERKFRCVYKGMAFYLADRLFLTDYESLTCGEISQMSLFPSHKSRTTFLHGLKLGVSADHRHTPAATRVVFEFLGTNINKRKALRSCGLYNGESDEISPNIRWHINNDDRSTDVHLVPANVQH